ncbi:MAG: ABC transporter ATP-binding protein [Gemmatimonadetes bacterium]|nr:MAG: ABC transporter ATP-binding protein [Gemmatimonadota bacterium]
MSEPRAAVAGEEPAAQPAAGVAPPLEARSLERVFVGGDGTELHVLQGVELRVDPGEVVAVVGASGAGKSTLLHLLGALDRPTRGEVRVGGRSLAGLSAEALAAVRNRYLGFVFQFHHLLREFSALENVMMPMLIAGMERAEARRLAEERLAAVGLAGRLDHRPGQLSGGEQQRVAVARALANDPLVLLADEPSGNLDEHTSERLHDLLFELRDRRGLAMVLVTHNRELAARADRILRLEDGVLHPLEDADDG